MINILIWILIVLFGLKQFCTAMEPLEFIRKYKEEPEKNHSMSLAPPVEIPILVFAIILAAFSNKDRWFNRPGTLAVYGVIAIIATYGLMILVGYISHLIIRKMLRPDK